ncbi:MAG: class B sortase [Christensenellales bacterium]|jgi:sortase B
MKKSIFTILATLLFTITLFSGYQLWRHLTDEQQAEEQFDNLASRREHPSEPQVPESSDETPSPEWTINDQYGLLFEQNHDMIGWIAIDGTGINYPVMQTPDRPNYYLNHSFEKQRSDHGVPYAAEGCKIDPQSDNITIYGHHMKSGKMFGSLDSYKNADFWREHPIIHFDTRAGFGTYEIIAVLKTNPDNFKYHQFISAADEAEFNEYVQMCKALSFYDTGVTAQYGDKLITLSTCEYSQPNNRLVVVARKIVEGG